MFETEQEYRLALEEIAAYRDRRTLISAQWGAMGYSTAQIDHAFVAHDQANQLLVEAVVGYEALMGRPQGRQCPIEARTLIAVG